MKNAEEKEKPHENFPLFYLLQWESNGPKECEQVGTICQILYPQTLQTKSNMEQNYPRFLRI